MLHSGVHFLRIPARLDYGGFVKHVRMNQTILEYCVLFLVYPILCQVTSTPCSILPMSTSKRSSMRRWRSDSGWWCRTMCWWAMPITEMYLDHFPPGETLTHLFCRSNRILSKHCIGSSGDSRIMREKEMKLRFYSFQSTVWSFLVTLFPIATFFGQFLAAWTCKRFGRKGIRSVWSCCSCRVK